MNIFRMTAIATATAVGLLAPPVAAATIDFNGLGVNTDDPVVVDGFTFDYVDNNGWAIGMASSLSIDFDNGTDVIICRDTSDAACGINMSSNAGVFSLSSFDGADGSFGVGGRTISVVGNYFGGGSVVQMFTTVADVFTTYSLAATFTNLVSVEFSVFGPGADDHMVLDNIVVNAAVPLPAAAPLLGLALFGLWGAGRRRNRV